MGLSIHYHGHFNPKSSLSEMILEVKDIAEIYKWKYQIFEDIFPANAFGKIEFDQNIYGIQFSPRDCEPVYLTFLSNGRMSSLSSLEFYGQSKVEVEQKYLYMLSTKTQYAGIEIHKLVIHLFKYLSQKYFGEFTMYDEGRYWETGDEKLLQEIFTQYSEMIESFSTALEIYPKKEQENFEDYFLRLLKQIRDKKKK